MSYIIHHRGGVFLAVAGLPPPPPPPATLAGRVSAHRCHDSSGNFNDHSVTTTTTVTQREANTNVQIISASLRAASVQHILVILKHYISYLKVKHYVLRKFSPRLSIAPRLFTRPGMPSPQRWHGGRAALVGHSKKHMGHT